MSTLTEESSNFSKSSRNWVITGSPSKSLKWLFTHNNTILVTCKIPKYVNTCKTLFTTKTTVQEMGMHNSIGTTLKSADKGLKCNNRHQPDMKKLCWYALPISQHCGHSTVHPVRSYIYLGSTNKMKGKIHSFCSILAEMKNNSFIIPAHERLDVISENIGISVQASYDKGAFTKIKNFLRGNEKLLCEHKKRFTCAHIVCSCVTISGLCIYYNLFPLCIIAILLWSKQGCGCACIKIKIWLSLEQYISNMFALTHPLWWPRNRTMKWLIAKYGWYKVLKFGIFVRAVRLVWGWIQLVIFEVWASPLYNATLSKVLYVCGSAHKKCC